MFWSSFDVETGVRLIRACGLEVRTAEIIEEDEDGETAGFLWVVARGA